MNSTVTKQWRILLAALTLNVLSVASAATLSDAQKEKVNVAFTQNTAYEFVASVERGKQHYRFVTFIQDFESSNGLAKQRALSGWKDDYLFVRQQCGQRTQWRCIVDQVFTLIGDRLVHLGTVESGSCKSLGCSYQEALFTDLFDLFQINPVTGDQDGPPLPIARRAKGDALVSDLDATWEINKEAFAKSLACLDQVGRVGFATPCADNLSAWGALVFAAKLARYTDRRAEWESLFANQATGYCKQSADAKCAWRVAGVKDFFGRIQPGAAPLYTPAPVTMVDPNKKEPPAVEKFQTGKPIKLGL